MFSLNDFNALIHLSYMESNMELTKIAILVKIQRHCNHFVALDLMIFAGMLLPLAYPGEQNNHFHSLRPRYHRSGSILHKYWDREYQSRNPETSPN